MPWQRGGKSIFSTPGDSPRERMVKSTTKLIRRAAIRRILSGRYGADGISSLVQLQGILTQQHGVTAHIMTISRDLDEMGAVKVQDVEKPKVQFWVVPAFNPNLENLRETMDSQSVEQEVFYKITMHVIDIALLYERIFIMTEPRAGHLVAYWISWLRWPGMVGVQEQLDGCIIHCLDPEHAAGVYELLVGHPLDGEEEPSAEAEEGEEEPVRGHDS